MKTRYGVSAWIAGYSGARRPEFPRLRGEVTTDVAIIGGGLTGVTTAFMLAAAGLKPVVLEAERVGEGTAGRSSGLLIPEPGPAFRDVQAAHGLRAARSVFEAWRRASIDAAALLRRANVRCAIAPCDSVAFARGDADRALRRELEAREAAGLDGAWLTASQVRQAVRLEDAAGGIRMRGAYALDPFRAALGLAAAASRRRARLFERTRVTRVRPGTKAVEIVCDGGTVTTGLVIVATGSATTEFAPLRRHFKRRERYLAMTEPVAAAVRKKLPGADVTLRDTAAPHHRLRWTPDHRLLIAGADQDETPAARREGVRVQRTGQLMYELLMMYPIISGLRPEFGWEAGYGVTADGIMYIGPHRNYPRHLFALGSGADSLTGAFLAARILTRAVQEEPLKGDEVFGWTR